MVINRVGPLSSAKVIGLLYAPLIARTVRAAVRAEREKEYVAAALRCGRIQA